MRPRSINIFLLDGDPDGIRVADREIDEVIAWAEAQSEAHRSLYQPLAA